MHDDERAAGARLAHGVFQPHGFADAFGHHRLDRDITLSNAQEAADADDKSLDVVVLDGGVLDLADVLIGGIIDIDTDGFRTQCVLRRNIGEFVRVGIGLLFACSSAS